MKPVPCILHGKRPYIHKSTVTTILGKRMPEKFWWKSRSALCGEKCSVLYRPYRMSIVREWNDRQRQLRKELREERRLEAERNKTTWQRVKELVSGVLRFWR